MLEEKCHACELTIDDATLHKCPVCFKYACAEHQHVLSGRIFCTKSCADYFFFSDPDD